MVTPKKRMGEIDWRNLTVQPEDIQALTSHLFETEDPLSIDELSEVLVKHRIELAKKALQSQEVELGKIYYPKDALAIGETISFPMADWIQGQIVGSRPGVNPELPEFSVITVTFDDGSKKEYASNLQNHYLNSVDYALDSEDETTITDILKEQGSSIKSKLRSALDNQSELVRIGYTWFPKSLLIDIGQGPLNLAEAILDANEGGPLETGMLINQLDLDLTENPQLLEFSLNYALQEDPRFEEVGSTGTISWFLKRLEPKQVLEVPLYLKVEPIIDSWQDLEETTARMIVNLNDEKTTGLEEFQTDNNTQDTSIVLNFPHWRTGSLPITEITKHFFPSALESDNVQFSLRDEQNDLEISAWVVRKNRYVYGLKDWYLDMNLIPGSIIELTRTSDPGVLLIKPQKKRSNKEWIKTVLVGADGGLVIALLRQAVYAGFNDRMAIAITDVAAIDEIWETRKDKNILLKTDVNKMMIELSKLNNQRHVHFVDLYASLNVIRRTTPFDLLKTLTDHKEFIHVGDHYYHLADQS